MLLEISILALALSIYSVFGGEPQIPKLDIDKSILVACENMPTKLPDFNSTEDILNTKKQELKIYIDCKEKHKATASILEKLAK